LDLFFLLEFKPMASLSNSDSSTILFIPSPCVVASFRRLKISVNQEMINRT
jgi:hypothetical protein